jgi:hypothetical protein
MDSRRPLFLSWQKNEFGGVAMTAIADARKDDLTARDRGFFLAMAVAIAVTVAAGFGLQFAAGRSSLASPWWVHLHGVTFAGWIGFYLLQNALVYRGAVAQHRALGVFGLAWASALIPVGLFVTCSSIAAHRTPPFFEPGFFLAMDMITVLTFYVFTLAAIKMRRRPDWHRRLMLAGTIFLTAPAWGRLIPLPLLGGELGVWAILAAQVLVFYGAAVWRDLSTRGRVHPAYFWGIAGSVAAVALFKPIGALPFVTELAARLAG